MSPGVGEIRRTRRERPHAQANSHSYVVPPDRPMEPMVQRAAKPESISWTGAPLTMRQLRKSRGFTLVEIMIVVLIIGILLAIAVPNFIKARESSRVRTCVANLKQIEAAKEQWAMENKKTSTDTPVQADLEGANGYIKKWPSCPSGGTYTINDVATAPACSLAAQGHTL